jgi:hypothetical protein
VWAVMLGAVAIVGNGSWEIADAIDAEVYGVAVSGEFKGYHVVSHSGSRRDTRGSVSQSQSHTYHPMFRYRDLQGVDHDVTGLRPHPFQHLEAGEKVRVLLFPGSMEEARIGDAVSLYGDSALTILVGVVLFALGRFGLRLVGRFMSPEPQPTDAFVVTTLRSMGAQQLPAGAIWILGGFIAVGLLGAGAALYLDGRRRDPGLAQALVDGHVERARQLAVDGVGVQGVLDGEGALIHALKTKQSETAQAILHHDVKAAVKSADGIPATHLAVKSGDHRTLALLLEHGARVYDVPAVTVLERMEGGDVDTLAIVFRDGFETRQSVGGHTLMEHANRIGKAEVIALVRQYAGP